MSTNSFERAGITGRAFQGDENLHDASPQKLLTKRFILPWLMDAPRTPNGVLDLACGQGIEASNIVSEGYRYVGMDASETLLGSGFHTNRVLADITALPFANNSFSKVLLKDSIIFFSKEDKLAMFQQLRDILVPQGSILIASQLGDRLRIHYLPKGSQLAQKESYSDDSGWRTKLDNIKTQGQVFSVEFLTEPANIQELAYEVGFSTKLLHKYSWNDPLAVENRWVHRAGFILQLVNNKPL